MENKSLLERFEDGRDNILKILQSFDDFEIPCVLNIVKFKLKQAKPLEK